MQIMDQPEPPDARQQGRGLTAPQEQKPRKEPNPNLPRGNDHFMVRWARARELLADEYGTGELLGQLQKYRDTEGPLHSWRERLAVAIWMYLSAPVKGPAHVQFYREWAPRQRYDGYKQGWKPRPQSAIPPRPSKPLGVSVPLDEQLLAVIEAWPKLPESARAYLSTIAKAVQP